MLSYKFIYKEEIFKALIIIKTFYANGNKDSIFRRKVV